jgi:hypothetical protein
MSERKEWYRAAKAFDQDDICRTFAQFLEEHGASYGLHVARPTSEAESAVERIYQGSLANYPSNGEDDDEQESDSLEDDDLDSDGEVRDEGEDDEDDEYEQETDYLEDDDNFEYDCEEWENGGEDWTTFLLQDASRTYFRFALRLPSLLDPDEGAFTVRYENDEPNKEEDIENYGAKAAETFAWMAKAFWLVLVILMLIQLARIESILRTMDANASPSMAERGLL